MPEIFRITENKYITFSILTKAATPLFAKIHNSKERRTVILNDDQISPWLSNGSKEKRCFMDIISNDVPDIIGKVDYPQVQIEY